MLRRRGIWAISSFALVDSDNDKNHTGEFLLKVQRRWKVGDAYTYGYIVAKMDKDGKFVLKEDGNPDICMYGSPNNTILFVCESDFMRRGGYESEPWTPKVGDVTMVHSTSSSHYSIFRQRIPDYDLKQVRHYLQFKNRL